MWRVVQLNGQYCPGDTIRVGEDSRADLTLANRSVLRLNANSEMTLEALREKRTSLMSLLKGASHFFSRGPRTLEVKTPYTVVGVRGTEFFVEVQADRTLMSIFEGEVLAANEVGELTLKSGQSAVAERGKAPVLRVVARPRDAVTWALYYPPVVNAREVASQVASPWREAVQSSAEFYVQGDLRQAFERLGEVPSDVRDPHLLAYRATLRLAVGQVDRAETDIARTLELNPSDSRAVALQTIIAVVQNKKEAALRLARQAVEASPESTTALVALSYAQQASLDLDGARASLEKAASLAPNDALAWARLAEIRSSFGELDAALEAAQRAIELEPELSRTQTVLGFAFLTQTKIADAVVAFEKAIELDQADPLPRLGLGLSKIRQGQLRAGSLEIEVAASLDPNNALLHSYLGKARFEEKLDPLDAREYDVAKQLDPQDPTPWFYDAIRKQTTNRPVAALRDLQEAIERNDNRAVYRSRLLLDSDEAARSASLARIYSDLGFQPRALIEGWQAVNLDPTNFSAHRFLADSYAVLPRHEIARVSELLQSQLLQPINLTPIQPRLAESNLFLIAAGGPATLSFNEFNPLFIRDRVALQVSGFAGENDTWSGEAVASGIYGRTSFSVGVSHFETDGFRANNDQDDDIVNAFVQTALSSQTSVQAEYRYRKTDSGDLTLNFFPEDFLPNLRRRREAHSIRFGARHDTSPQSTFLASLMFQFVDSGTRDEMPDGFVLSFEEDSDGQDAVSSELQHIWRSKFIKLISGGGLFKIDAQTVTEAVLNLPPPPFGPGQLTVPGMIDNDILHLNLYAYAYISVLKNVTVTLGGSGDIFSSDNPQTEGEEQFNPKFGLIWQPLPSTTVRAAVFRVLRRTLITDQTLEPTQVAGFNQFFDDVNATDAWRYGLAIDQKLLRSLYAGLEFAKRDLKIPFTRTTPAGTTLERADADEYFGRAYVLWAPHDWLALSAAYQYERFKREEGAFAFEKATTHRLPLGLRFFHPSGWSASLQATYFNQDGDFIHTDRTVESGDDTFWTVDAAVRYRLPKRYGFLSLGVTNLFNEKFRYQETDQDNPAVIPDRVVFGQFTLSMP